MSSGVPRRQTAGSAKALACAADFSFAIFSTLRTMASKFSMDDLQKPSTWSILDLKSFLTSRRDAIASSLLTSIKRDCFFKEAACLLSYQ